MNPQPYDHEPSFTNGQEVVTKCLEAGFSYPVLVVSFGGQADHDGDQQGHVEQEGSEVNVVDLKKNKKFKYRK